MSRYFSAEQVSDGVWVAACQDKVWAMSNAAIVDLGQQTLVVDSGASPQAAQELRAIAQDLTQNRVAYLLNTHHHTDHVLGNQVFADTCILAGHTTRTLMQERFVRLFEQDAKQLPQAMLELQQRQPTTAWEQELYALEMAELNALQEILPNLQPTLPSVVFENKLEILGTKRSAKVLSFGVGHTAQDSVLLVDDVLVAGDLVLQQNLAFLGHGDLNSWLLRLEDLASITKVRQIIPGHGAVCAPQAIAEMCEQLLEIQTIAQNTTDIKSAQPPTHWQSWGLPGSFRANLERLKSL